jgi:hypothetical protein
VIHKRRPSRLSMMAGSSDGPGRIDWTGRDVKRTSATVGRCAGTS